MLQNDQSKQMRRNLKDCNIPLIGRQIQRSKILQMAMGMNNLDLTVHTLFAKNAAIRA